MNYEELERYGSLPFSNAEIETLCGLEAGTIENDQEAIWDRLPSHLSDLLFPPSSNPALKLPAHLWTPLQRFGWHRRLLIRIQKLFSSS